MKICDLTQFYSPVSGGVKRYLSEKRRHLQRSHNHEHILIVPGARTECIHEEHARTYTIASPLISRTSRYRALLNLHAVEEILESESPDIIESGDPYQMAWKALASGQGLRIPVVAFYHSHFPEAYLRTTAKYLGRAATDFVMDLSRRYVRALYSQFHATLVPSKALADLLKEWGVNNIVPVDLGVDTSIFRPTPDDRLATRAKLGIPPDVTLLLYVGRLAIEKNTRTLFQAFEIITQSSPGRFHLLAVGDGNQRPLIEALRQRTGAATWIPYCSDSAELASLYRAADLFVHPGILETFGLVTLEAQACGTPVVGIKGSYMDRIIFTDQQHWAAENTPEALATAVTRMADACPADAGRAASARVHADFSWHSVFSRQLAIYHAILANTWPSTNSGHSSDFQQK